MRSGLCRVVSPHLVTYLRACARVGVDNRGTRHNPTQALARRISLSAGPFPIAGPFPAFAGSA
jgi:hypothetical protein